ncbi:ABC transporter ATP-binding protein [Clostridium sp. JNZ X4-2]
MKKVVKKSKQESVNIKDRQYKIVIDNVRKCYNIKSQNRQKDEEFLTLDNFNLKVKKGEFITVVGPSGCGKSTFLDILAGLSRPTSGKVYIDGKLITAPALDRGIILQGYALFPWRTVEKNIEFGLEIKGMTKDLKHQISKKFIDLVGLNGFENRYPHELSGGMKQRVAIARALAYDPEVLLMDEPFAAVDAQTRESLQEELLNIWEKTNKTIVFITHSIEEAVFLADRVVVMSTNPGRIKEIINIKLPRPRINSQIRTSQEFNSNRNRIWELLHGDADKIQAEAMV